MAATVTHEANAFLSDPRPTAAETVAVVGLGYVGLPTALALHAAGMRVLGLDTSSARLDMIVQGRPDLLPHDHGRLALARPDRERFVLCSDAARLPDADTVIICVPTPIDDHLMPDLGPLRSACDTVVASARPGQTIVVTSTTYVGSTREFVIGPLIERGLTPGTDVHVCFSPERIDPANTRFAQSAVPRVVGGFTPACSDKAAAVVSRISGGVHCVSSLEAAEMTKLLENTFRAVNIALANEFADAAHCLGLDPVEVVDAAATKPFGFMPFYPGAGVGGHCIPCDPHYLLWQLRRDHVHPAVIGAAMEGISTRPGRVVDRAGEVLERVGATLFGAKVLVVGVAYKPDVADPRESPALGVISGLLRRGADVSIHDPLVRRVEVDHRVHLSVDAVEPGDYDLVIVCCRHDCMDERIILEAPLLLDATYRLPPAANRHIP
jgi:UDP-N-acetyl-D-glucosamine dehydrogenase